MDADIAEESINYSKYSMQYQAAAALAQSNLTTEVVMDLLLSINRKKKNPRVSSHPASFFRMKREV